MRVYAGVLVAGLALCTPVSAIAAPAADCTVEEAALVKDQAELPKLEIASRKDKPPYCVTLETLMAFANRLKAHVIRCAGSGLAAEAPDLEKSRAEYGRLWAQTRCKRTIFD